MASAPDVLLGAPPELLQAVLPTRQHVGNETGGVALVNMMPQIVEKNDWDLHFLEGRGCARLEAQSDPI